MVLSRRPQVGPPIQARTYVNHNTRELIIMIYAPPNTTSNGHVGGYKGAYDAGTVLVNASYGSGAGSQRIELERG